MNFKLIFKFSEVLRAIIILIIVCKFLLCFSTFQIPTDFLKSAESSEEDVVGIVLIEGNFLFLCLYVHVLLYIRIQMQELIYMLYLVLIVLLDFFIKNKCFHPCFWQMVIWNLCYGIYSEEVVDFSQCSRGHVLNPFMLFFCGVFSLFLQLWSSFHGITPVLLVIYHVYWKMDNVSYFWEASCRW